MVDRKRERLLTVRMNDAEMAMLEGLADGEGISASEWIRNVVRREHALASVRPHRSKPKPKK